jgi:HAMP domain-containing protein
VLRVGGITRIIRVAAAALAGLLYLWFAAVRNLPRVRRRKAARRS